MTSSKSRERTHEASIDNMANEDSLLYVVWDLLKVLSAASYWNFFQRWQQFRGSLAWSEVQ